MIQYVLATNHPVATDSQDHQVPGGTMHDSSRNPKFNAKLYELFPGQTLHVLDLGCAGGGFVANCIEDGHEALGLEGSDYSLKRKRAEWARYPNNLATCDVTKPFQVNREVCLGENEYVHEPVVFDVVTAWEFMEHVKERDLSGLCKNVRNHLRPNGLWIMSVSEQHGQYHETVRPKFWWLGLLKREGFENDESLIEHFGDEWVRGPKQNAPESFHLVLRKAKP